MLSRRSRERPNHFGCLRCEGGRAEKERWSGSREQAKRKGVSLEVGEFSAQGRSTGLHDNQSNLTIFQTSEFRMNFDPSRSRWRTKPKLSLFREMRGCNQTTRARCCRRGRYTFPSSDPVNKRCVISHRLKTISAEGPLFLFACLAC
jgi:hypothetical protein